MKSSLLMCLRPNAIGTWKSLCDMNLLALKMFGTWTLSAISIPRATWSAKVADCILSLTAHRVAHTPRKETESWPKAELTLVQCQFSK